jgi:copper chaperone CopZ
MDHHNCHVEVETKDGQNTSAMKRSTVDLLISGMGCQNCAKRVHNSVLRQSGVLDVEVILESRLARVVFDPSQITTETLLQAVSAAGNDGHHHYSAILA